MWFCHSKGNMLSFVVFWVGNHRFPWNASENISQVLCNFHTTRERPKSSHLPFFYIELWYSSDCARFDSALPLICTVCFTTRKISVMHSSLGCIFCQLSDSSIVTQVNYMWGDVDGEVCGGSEWLMDFDPDRHLRPALPNVSWWQQWWLEDWN